MEGAMIELSYWPTEGGTMGSMKDGLGVPKVVDRGTFQEELDILRVREKAHTREGDAIAAARRRLPMVARDLEFARFCRFELRLQVSSIRLPHS